MNSPSLHSFTLAFALIVALVLVPNELRAQDNVFVEVTQDQWDRTNQAVNDLVLGNHDKAIAAFEALLAENEVNVLYLNLGRAHAKAGHCQEADAAYRKVATAPILRNPSPQEVNKLLEKYRQELTTTCPGTVIVVCQPADMQLQIDEGALTPCTGKGIPVEAGRHTLTGVVGKRKVTQKLLVEGMKTVTVNLSMALSETPPPPKEDPRVTPRDEMGTSPLLIAGIVTSGVGVLTLLGALGYDQIVLAEDFTDFEAAAERGDQPRYDELRESLTSGQTFTLVLVGAGSLLVVGGAVMSVIGLVPGETPPQPGATTSRLAPWVGPGEAGIGWTGRF